MEPREEGFKRNIQDRGPDVKTCCQEQAQRSVFGNEEINLRRKRSIWKDTESSVKQAMLEGDQWVGKKVGFRIALSGLESPFRLLSV